MEDNSNCRIPTVAELMETETYKKDRRYFEGFRIGYACGRNDAIDELTDCSAYATGFENGYEAGVEDGYDEGYEDAVGEILGVDETDEDITAEKPTDEESLLEFLDSLSLADQRAALIHLSLKWAEKEGEKSDDR
jgi:hypothetical protein